MSWLEAAVIAYVVMFLILAELCLTAPIEDEL